MGPKLMIFGVPGVSDCGDPFYEHLMRVCPPTPEHAMQFGPILDAMEANPLLEAVLMPSYPTPYALAN